MEKPTVSVEFIDLGDLLGMTDAGDGLMALTLEELRPLVAALPEGTIRDLAQGPKPDPGCHYCDCIMRVPEDGSPADEAAYRLSKYHAFDKRQVRPLIDALMNAGLRPRDGRVQSELDRFMASMRYHRAQVVYLLALEWVRERV